LDIVQTVTPVATAWVVIFSVNRQPVGAPVLSDGLFIKPVFCTPDPEAFDFQVKGYLSFVCRVPDVAEKIQYGVRQAPLSGAAGVAKSLAGRVWVVAL
jgi:hypothetical protein